MNCPTCNTPMRTRTVSDFEETSGKKWVYEFQEMVCDDHPQQSWQTQEQLHANLEAIRAVRKAAAKLKKATI